MYVGNPERAGSWLKADWRKVAVLTSHPGQGLTAVAGRTPLPVILRCQAERSQRVMG